MAKLNLSNQANIIKAIGSLSSRGKKLKVEAGLIAIAVMEHMDNHGDYTMAPTLFDACQTAFGKNMKRAMEEYFLAYTWLKYDETLAKQKDVCPYVKDGTKSMKIEEAKAVVWYETERQAPAKPFDAQTAIRQLLKRALETNGVNPSEFEEVFMKEFNEAKVSVAKKAKEDKKTEDKKVKANA